MVAQEKINFLRKKIDEADAIVVGAASGMSAASGFVFYYQDDEVYRSLAGGLAEKYDRHNYFDLFYERRLTRGERWAMLLRTARYLYGCDTGGTYTDLAELLAGKNYYIATTNQDAQFFRVFPAERITCIQGDWRFWQCSRPCHDHVYFKGKDFANLADKIENDELPNEFIPRCPHCGADLMPWVRGYTFLEGEYYQAEMHRYTDFLRQNIHRKVLFLELGVGMMTPMFIKEPFMNMVYQWSRAFYATINPLHAIVPREIERKSIAIEDDIAITLKQLLGKPTDGIKDMNKGKTFNPSRVY